jgi:hypothetical protein
MFNKLYLTYRNHNGKHIYWTQIGYDCQGSREYRDKAQLAYTHAKSDTIKDFEFKNEEETKAVQRMVNNVFKEWTNKGEYKNMQICINLIQADMINTVIDVIAHKDDDNYLMGVMDSLHNRFTPKLNKGTGRLDKIEYILTNLDKGGTVYLMECANDKYKIGMTHDLNRRFDSLKEDEHYKAISIVDSFHSVDAAYDEAMLHAQCSKYKQNSNGTIRYVQDYGNSELFSKCDEVMEIWNKYKETHKEYSII